MNIGRTLVLCAFLPVLLAAQSDAEFTQPESAAPPEVSQALHDRADLFFQYHVGIANRKAMDLVAEDTKDEYFTSGKMKLMKYKLSDVRFMPGFTKARVIADATREWGVQTDVVVVTLPMVTTWKIEDGKWVWYHDRAQDWATPMGPGLNSAKPVELLRQDADGKINLPQNFDNPATLMAQAQAIFQQSKIDKDSITIVQGTKLDEQIVFKNGYGDVQLELGGVPNVPGLKVSLEKSALTRGEDGVVKIHYDPPARETSDSAYQMQQYQMRLTIQPFTQQFQINLTLRLPQ